MANMLNLPRFDSAALSRTLVGFDHLLHDVNRHLNQVTNNYPPFNIAKVRDNEYLIELAVTGFCKDEITVQVENNNLIVRSERASNEEKGEYLHRGLAFRNFERAFTLAENMRVQRAEIRNGVLSILLERIIPEEKKPKLIDIVEYK